MKILYITEFFPTGRDLKFSGGVEARTFFVAKHLAKKHKVYVLTSRISGTRREEKMFNFTVFRVGNTRSYNATAQDIIERLKFIKSAISYASSMSVDLIDSSNFVTHLVAEVVSRRKKIPAVVWYPDVWVGSWIKITGLAGIAGEFLERINLWLGANAYIAISKTTANKLKKYTNRKIHVIPCGIDKNEFLKTVNKFKDPTIICVSRLAKYKNIKTLILSFAHLSIQVKDAKLIIIGQGPEYKNLKELAYALKVKNKVKFLSNIPRSQLISTIKSSHILSLPSLTEGFGIATIEACAAGIPYVNSDIPVQREITNDARGGYLVDPSRPLEFSKKFEQLINDKKVYAEKSKEAKNLALSYNWQKISADTEKIYLKVI